MKRLTIRLALAGALSVLGIAGGGAACAAEASQTLRFGVEAQYPPFESKAADGSLQGFDIDLGNAVCQAAKLSCKWVETSFDGLIPALQGRKFDAINSSMNATAQRRQAIDFSTIVYHVPTRLIARVSSGLGSTPEALKGRRVGVLQGSIQETYAKVHWAPAGVSVVSYQDQNQAYADLVAGRLDATLVLAPAGQRGFLSRPDSQGFGFVGEPVRDERILGNGVAFGLRKGDDALRARLNAAIERLKADGTVAALGRKYFGEIDISVR